MRGLRRRLAVLRRRRHEGDLSTGRLGIKEPIFEPNGLHLIAVRYVRLLGKGPAHERYYLVPATVYPSDAETPVVCGRRAPRGTSPEQERRRERRAIRTFGAYLVAISSDGSFNTPRGLGGRAHELLHNRIGTSFADPRANTTTAAGVIPDWVARVRVTFERHGQRVFERSNLWIVRVHGSLAPDRLDAGLTTEWLDSHGRVRRTFHGAPG